MSLLEDVFLQDEANEAEELERVIEGDEFDERRRSDSDENSEKDDEAEEDKRRVDPTKTKTTRVVKNPRFLLNPARLTGPRGIQVIPDHFKDFKFKGKGHEKEDLDLVLKKLEHWAYRLYPKFQFEDCLKKIEILGKKRPVAVHLHKIRSDQFLSEDTVVQKESSDEETPIPVPEEDEFDKLLQQQIELARSTPAPNSTKKPHYDDSISPKDRTTPLMIPKATSSPSINEEQRERMLRSRRLAEERRLARLKNIVSTDNAEVPSVSRLVSTNMSSTDHNVLSSELNMGLSEEINKNTKKIAVSKKHNRSNVIDSSDEETEVETFVSVAVDVHTVDNITNENDMTENEKSIHNINVDIYSEPAQTKEIEKTTENNISHLDTEGHGNLNIADNFNEKSEEELRYDDYDMNLNLNKDNDTDKNKRNSKKIHGIEERIVSNETDIITKGLDKDALCFTERISKIQNDKPVNVPVEIVQDVMEEENDKTEDVPDEIIENIMDVDFTEDF